MAGGAKRPYTIEVDEDFIAGVGSQIKRIIQSKGARSLALQLLPEAKIISEILERGWREEDIIHYVILSAINDWNLRWLKGGAETLWREMFRILEGRPYTGITSYTSILDELAENLRKQGLRNDRVRQIKELGRTLDEGKGEKLQALVNKLSGSREIELSQIEEALKDLDSSLRRDKGSRIPVDKASNLIARTLHLMLGKNIKDKEKGTILYDLHIAKTSLRLGVVQVTLKNTGLVAISIYDNKLKQKVIEAWSEISERINVSAWVIDAILWDVGKNYCTLDDQEGSVDWSDPSCPQRRLARRNRCPLAEACKASRQNLKILILGKYIAGSPIVLAYKK